MKILFLAIFPILVCFLFDLYMYAKKRLKHAIL